MKGNRYNSEWINKLEGELHWRYYWQQLNLIYDFIKKYISPELMRTFFGLKIT
jgi:hypothetical protein